MRDKGCELRVRLQAMTMDGDVSNHAAQLAAITETHLNSVQPLPSEQPIASYTCAMHALGLVGNPTYKCIAQFGLGRIYAGKDFVHWLIATKWLEETATPEPGGIGVYFDAGEFKHIGKCAADGRICSKWGTGLLYDHSVDEVPSSYGNDVRFYKLLPNDASISAFVVFASESGVPASFIEHCRKKESREA